MFESILHKPKSLKQEVTDPLLNARWHLWLSRALRDDQYKRMFRVIVSVTCKKPLIIKGPLVPSERQNLKPFSGNGDVSVWVKNSRMRWKASNKQINLLGSVYDYLPEPVIFASVAERLRQWYCSYLFKPRSVAWEGCSVCLICIVYVIEVISTNSTSPEKK